jgi:transcription initiation factor TFIIH subunit 3
MITSSQERSLLVLILDITPSVWGERERHRMLQDQTRLTQGKKSIGPALFDSDLLPAILTFLTAFGSMRRDNCAVVIAVAGRHVSVVYPRKGMPMESMILDDVRETGGATIDAVAMTESITLGVAEMMTLFTQDLEVQATETTTQVSSSCPRTNKTMTGSSIVAATSIALCIINRFMVAFNRGVSALENNLLQRRETDQGVLELIGGHNHLQTGENGHLQQYSHILSPRILIVQASEDRIQDYNAFMNCIFAANKGSITIDGCFLPSGITNQAKSSSFLEQACDSTGGIFTKPMGPAQIDGALTEVMISLFLPSIQTRKLLNLPKVTTVDYRPRCFDRGGETIDQGFVCNQCLSIFKERPSQACLTCGAKALIPNIHHAD